MNFRSPHVFKRAFAYFLLSLLGFQVGYSLFRTLFVKPLFFVNLFISKSIFRLWVVGLKWASSGPFPLSAHYGLYKRGKDPSLPNPSRHLKKERSELPLKWLLKEDWGRRSTVATAAAIAARPRAAVASPCPDPAHSIVVVPATADELAPSPPPLIQCHYCPAPLPQDLHRHPPPLHHCFHLPPLLTPLLRLIPHESLFPSFLLLTGHPPVPSRPKSPSLNPACNRERSPSQIPQSQPWSWQRSPPLSPCSSRNPLSAPTTGIQIGNSRGYLLHPRRPPHSALLILPMHSAELRFSHILPHPPAIRNLSHPTAILPHIDASFVFTRSRRTLSALHLPPSQVATPSHLPSPWW